MKRTLVIGDIHGALKALEQVFQKAGVTTDDRLIFLGDYVDGWSESAAVIDHLLQLEARQPCIFIKGNHDGWCEAWLQTNKADDSWLFHGGRETIKSYAAADGLTMNKHLDFFKRIPYYSTDGQKRLFIHAGFTSFYGPSTEFNPVDLSWDRTLWETAITMGKNIKKDPRLLLFHEIYIGHTPTIFYGIDVPMHRYNVWNMDTGAAFTGKLSLMDINTKQFWQSDPVYLLYPGEKGRNKI